MKADKVAAIVDRDSLTGLIGGIVDFPDGLLVESGCLYPDGTPVRVALVLSNGKLLVSDYGHGLKSVINTNRVTTRPGYFLAKAAKMYGVRYDNGIVYASIDKNTVSVRGVVDAIRAVSTATQNGVVMTPKH